MAVDWDSTRENSVYVSDSGISFSHATAKAYHDQAALGWTDTATDLPNKPRGLKPRRILVKGDVTAGLYRWVTVATLAAYDAIVALTTAIKIQDAAGDEEAGKAIRFSGERWRGRQRIGT